MCLAFLIMLAGEWATDTDSLSGFFGHLSGIAVTEKGEVVVLDYSQPRVYHLDADGREIGHFGREGSGPGEIRMAEALHYTPDGPFVLVADAGALLIHVYHLDGSFVRDIRSGENEVMAGRFLSGGRTLMLATEDPIARPNRGARLILQGWDGNQPRELLRFSTEAHRDPHVGHHDGTYALLAFPWDPKVRFAASPDGRWLFVGPNSEVDFRVLDAVTGRQTGRIRDTLPRRPLRRADLEANRQRLAAAGKMFTARSFRHGDFQPAIGGIFADNAERLWVRHLAAQGARQARFSVYARDGAKQGFLSLPIELTVIAADENHLWAHREQGESWLVVKRRYRLEH